MAKSKLIPSIIIGAAVGATISMFDKETRQHTINIAKKAKNNVTYYARNVDELQQAIETKLDKAQHLLSTAEQNINSFAGKKNDTTSLPETISTLLVETKEAFTKK